MTGTFLVLDYGLHRTGYAANMGQKSIGKVDDAHAMMD